MESLTAHEKVDWEAGSLNQATLSELTWPASAPVLYYHPQKGHLDSSCGRLAARGWQFSEE
jgi:hypothetical protein